MKLLFFARRVNADNYVLIKRIIEQFLRAGFEVSIYEHLLRQLHGHVTITGVSVLSAGEDLRQRNIDYLIVVGGDGSILDATVITQDSGVPIVGINLGRLGFLASIEPAQVDDVIRSLKAHTILVEERSLLKLTSNRPMFHGADFALNDFTILKRDTSSMIKIHTYINGNYLTTYWADGIIMATPTGSTAYSLSCGGPILFPTAKSFVLTPVAPHNLNVRPLIIPDSDVVTFQVEGRSSHFLCTLDTRMEMITSEYEIAIQKSDFTVKLARLDNVSFMRGLREKLAWGTDKRN